MVWSERVYWMAVKFKMTDSVKQQICIKFCVKLEHSSAVTIWMLQKAAAMGNWCLAASWQHACSCIMSCAEIFFVKYQITQVTQSPHPPQTRLGVLWPLAVPKLKSPLKRKRFQTINKIQENMMRQLMAIGRTVWGPKVPTLKGTEASLSYVQCFLYLV